MIYRAMFVAYSNTPESIELLPDIPYYAALARDGDRVFLYVESNEKEVDPQRIVRGELQQYPNGKLWARSAEIFHYSVPMNAQQWKRKCKKTPCFRINRLKPERIASYVYYHFQYQEEYPGDGDRYGVIYLMGDLLVFYQEEPTEKETEKIQGLLNTHNSPIDEWQDVMNTHFMDTWRPIELQKFSDYIDFGE